MGGGGGGLSPEHNPLSPETAMLPLNTECAVSGVLEILSEIGKPSFVTLGGCNTMADYKLPIGQH